MESDKSPDKWSGVAKFAAISAAVFLLSVGLCGLSLRGPNSYNGGLAVASLIGMIVGALGLFGAACTAVILLFTKGK